MSDFKVGGRVRHKGDVDSLIIMVVIELEESGNDETGTSPSQPAVKCAWTIAGSRQTGWFSSPELEDVDDQ